MLRFCLGCVKDIHANLRFSGRFLHYIQGQSPESRVREYFYYVDHQGQVCYFCCIYTFVELVVVLLLVFEPRHMWLCFCFYVQVGYVHLKFMMVTVLMGHTNHRQLPTNTIYRQQMRNY